MISAVRENRDPQQKELFIDLLYRFDVRLRIDAYLKLARRLQSNRIPAGYITDRISVHVYYLCLKILGNLLNKRRHLVEPYLDAFVIHDEVFHFKSQCLPVRLA